MHNIFLENIIKNTQSSVGQLKVRSALNPILWLCGIWMPVALVSAYLFRDDAVVKSAFVFSSISLLFFVCIVFAYFAAKKPEKLQSEDYQIRHAMMEYMQKKGSSQLLSPDTLKAISNPNPKKINKTKSDA